MEVESAQQQSSRSDEELLQLLALPSDLAGQPVETEMEPSEEEKRFLEERRTTLGGTDSAAICGFSGPYRNAWDVAAEKKGMLPIWRGNERTEIGRLLEDPVAKAYSQRTGLQLERVDGVTRDQKSPFLGGHPDRLVIGAKKGVEIKTVEFGFEKWSKPGEPLRVPQGYYVQCQHYMMITGYEAWDLVALFGLSKIRWYTLERNEKVISALRQKDETFWGQYVEGPDLPPMEPSESAKAWLKDKYSAPKTDDLLVATEEQAEAIAHWREAKSSREAFQEEEERWKIRVQSAIGDATGIAADGVTVTWKKNKDTIELVTNWQEVAMVYREQLLNLTPEHRVLIDVIPERFTRSVVTRTGPRVLRVSKAKG
jgi:putative phage-type endonuclease